ncbi:hypothetical protein ACTJKH_16445 [Microbacterium sp. 22215]|uniref:hypothetical protein n=1 Tax=Microbacterium sp. 22215 TaxID=3453893 RepID=UPI003F86402A
MTTIMKNPEYYADHAEKLIARSFTEDYPDRLVARAQAYATLALAASQHPTSA